MTDKKISISKRKSDHIQICMTKDVDSGVTNGLERFRFEHNALPEIDFAKITTQTEFLGKKLGIPLLISSITGGIQKARFINQNLARAAEHYQIAFALGSLRALLENPASLNTFRIRKIAPSILLLANIGAVQLNYGVGLDECKKIIDMVQADGLILHLNSLQEVFQTEGDLNFAGLLRKIEILCRTLPVPVIIKEVGWGISKGLAKDLFNAGIRVIDVAGAGGTSWSQVELHRASDSVLSKSAEAFRDWGISTANSIVQTRSVSKRLSIIASGGIRNGVEVAKCIALGANLVGLAKPFLAPALISDMEIHKVIDTLSFQLRAAMFATGNTTIAELAKTKLVGLD